MSARSEPHSTTEQLRDDIDSGRTGEKINWSDPAAVPLGADDEAAGTPPSGADVHRVRAREVKHGDNPTQRGLGAAWIQIAFVAVCLFALAGSAWVFTR
jgi:hypothetical protein